MSLISNGILKRLQNGTNLQDSPKGETNAPKTLEAKVLWLGEPCCSRCGTEFPINLYIDTAFPLEPMCSFCYKQHAEEGGIIQHTQIYRLNKQDKTYTKITG